jgi:hypothetical protein
MASQDDIFSTLQNGVVALRELNTTIASFFPRVDVVITIPSSVAGATFNSSQVLAYFVVETSSGAFYRVPLYASS